MNLYYYLAHGKTELNKKKGGATVIIAIVHLNTFLFIKRITPKCDIFTSF